MWKKTDTATSSSSSSTDSSSSDAASSDSLGSVGRRRRATSDGAVIGTSIVVKGDISGSENLLIQGRVEGNVDLEEHTIVVGESGDVEANLNGNHVEVEGQVEGDITGRDRITIRATGRVKGDIKAPKVVLEEGSQFRGSVEMDVDNATRSGSSSGKVSSISDSDKLASA